MSETTFLTPEEVANAIVAAFPVGTLRNWRGDEDRAVVRKNRQSGASTGSTSEAWDDRNRVSAAPEAN